MAKLPKIQNKALLRQALTHRSLPNHNERLEFIGDGILQGVVTAILSQRFPNGSEGFLSQERAKLVSNQALAKVARKLKLRHQLYLAEGAIKQGGRNNSRILSGTVEALIGAYFLDSGCNFQVVERYIRQLLNL